jgi:hypothetical protein
MAIAAALLATACSSSPPDLTGKWKFSPPGLVLTLDFNKDGTYKGVMIGQTGANQVSGTFKITANDFTMSPPLIHNPDGTTGSPDEQHTMHLQVVSSSQDNIILSDGEREVPMTREKD